MTSGPQARCTNPHRGSLARGPSLPRVLLVGIAISLVLAPIPLPASGQGGDALTLDLIEACPPQMASCLDLTQSPVHPCAWLASPERTFGLEVQVLDAQGQPVPQASVHVHSPVQEGRFSTGQDGTAFLGIQEATDITIEAHDGEATGAHPISPTWGLVEVTAPTGTQLAPMGQPTTLAVEARVAGTGPSQAVTGDLLLDLGEDGHGGLSLVDGSGTVQVPAGGPRLAGYPVLEAAVCGLPLAETAPLEIDWYPTELEISPSTLQLPAVDTEPVVLETTGIGPDGEPVTVDAATEIAWSTDPAGLANLEGDTLTLATTTAGSYTLTGQLLLNDTVTTSVPLVVEPGPPDRYEVSCEAPLVGAVATWCHAEAVDLHGNTLDAQATGWSATAGEILLAPGNGSILYEPPGQGGQVTLQVDDGTVTGGTTLGVDDGEGPLLGLGVPNHPRAGRTTSFQLSAEDPSGIGEVTWAVDGQQQAVLDGQGATGLDAPVEHRFPSEGFYDLAITATDSQGHTSTLTTRVLVLPLPAHGAPRLVDQDTGDHATIGTGDNGATGEASPGEQVVAQATGSGSFTARLTATDGRTAWASTPQGDVEVRLDTRQAGTFEVEITPGLDQLPEDPVRRVLSAFDVSVTGQAPVDQGRLRFTVPADQVNGAGGSPDQVALLHWDGESWDRRPTRQLAGEDPLRYQALTDGFSPFAVVLETATSTAPGLLRVDATPLQGETDRYEATFHAQADEQPVDILATDGRFLISLMAPAAGSYTLEATLGGTSPAGTPSSPTEQARFLELSLRDRAGQRVDLSEATMELRWASGAQEGVEARTIVVAEPGERTWSPVDAVVGEEAGTTVAWVTGLPTHPLAFLVDTEDPEVGLTSAPPATLTEATELTVVARDNVAVGRVTLRIDDQAVHTLYERPYTFTLDPADLEPGEHAVTFHATDLAGNKAISPWQVTVPGEEALDPAGQNDPGSDRDAGGEEDRGIPLGSGTLMLGATLALLVAHLQARGCNRGR